MSRTPSVESFEKLSVVARSHDYRTSTKIVPASLPATPGDHEVYVRMRYLGINASDMLYLTAETSPVPRDWGFEGIGVVEKVGALVKKVEVNDVVGFLQPGAFAEYVCVHEDSCIKFPAMKPELMDIIVSGMTSSIALGDLGEPKKGDVALVTAAAGGAGHIAVQLLKHHYGCTVIGTCSSPEKASFLTSIGCDHVLDYRTDDVDARLTELAPNGLNIIFESVGGEMFNTALRHAAIRARVLVIGHISNYKTGEKVPWHHPTGVPLATFLLTHSISVRYFHLSRMLDSIPKYIAQMLEECGKGRLALHLDAKPFKGMTGVYDAIDHLYSGTSFGKIVVEL